MQIISIDLHFYFYFYGIMFQMLIYSLEVGEKDFILFNELRIHRLHLIYRTICILQMYERNPLPKFLFWYKQCDLVKCHEIWRYRRDSSLQLMTAQYWDSTKPQNAYHQQCPSSLRIVDPLISILWSSAIARAELCSI